MKNPCSPYCEDRVAGCHSDCFAWNVYSAGMKKKREKELEAKKEDTGYYGYQSDKAKAQYSKQKVALMFKMKRRRK